MGLIICDLKEAGKPYYIDVLGINIYSMEELCYIIYEHTMLVCEGFIDEGLFEFLEKELNLRLLAFQLAKMQRDRNNDDELLVYILEYSGFYTKAECNKYRQKLLSLRKLPLSEFLKLKADYMFGLKKYGKAVRIYSRILKLPKDKGINSRFLGAVHNNLASSYANMFLFDKAYENYDKAYTYLRDIDILKRIYFILNLQKDIGISIPYPEIIENAENSDWDKEFEAEKESVLKSLRLKEIDEILSYDRIKRSGIIENMISIWKQEYRNMM